MHILLLLDKVLYKCPLLIYGAVQYNYMLIFCLPNMSVTHRDVIKFPIIKVNLSISPCSHIRFCSHLYALLFGVYILRIIMSSWRNDSFRIISCLTLSLIIFFARVQLSEISIATPAFFCLAFCCYIFLFF